MSKKKKKHWTFVRMELLGVSGGWVIMFSAAEGSVKQGPGAFSFLGSFIAKRASEGVEVKS